MVCGPENTEGLSPGKIVK